MKIRHRRGFTLVELLVVIGIIALLVGILIPVVSNVRKSAYAANTKSLMQKISAACATYQLTFNAYPGIMPNMAYPGGAGGMFADPSYKNFTQSEDLVVTLAGGLKLNAAGKFEFDPQYLGQGPTNFNPLNPGKAHTAFISADPGDITPKDTAGTYQIGYTGNPINDLNQPFVQDSPAPEFMDKFPDPRPIIYARANRGAMSAAGGASIISPTYNAAFHYNFGAVAPYLNTGDTAETLAGGPSKPEVVTYFTSEQSTTSAKYAGTYILISAGPDRKFGTADDIIMGGGGGGQ
jgi:prepilin-type N-terminal cleavage/methylation domain-containing protein